MWTHASLGEICSTCWPIMMSTNIASRTEMVHQRCRMLFHRGTVLSCKSASISQCNGGGRVYLKAVNSRNFLLEDFINQTVLLYHGHPFEGRARNGNGIERPTATCADLGVNTYYYYYLSIFPPKNRFPNNTEVGRRWE